MAALLLIPLALTIRDGAVEGVGWNWTLSDFIFMGTLLFGAGVVYELVSRKIPTGIYRCAVGLSVATALLLVWINAAVGIIGEDEWPNLLYLVMLVFGFFGALIFRFQPRGMTLVLFSLAIAQMAVPAIVYVFDSSLMTTQPPGLVRVLLLNAFFATLWFTSAFLFRQVEGNKQRVHFS